jgi:GT2 family glycosyltransferase
MSAPYAREFALATSSRAEMSAAIVAGQSDDAALLSICIVTAGRSDDAVAAVESALAQDDDGPREIVVVDNASTDDTVSRLRTRFPHITVVASPVNLGCPGGRNLAMLVARGSWFLHLDDDGVLAPDAVRLARAHAAAFADAAILMFNIEERGCERLVAPTGTLLPAFSGGACMMRRSALSASGLYAPEFLRQGEETDLLLRLFELGWTVRYCHDVRMLHRPRHRAGASAAATVRLIEQHRIVNESLTAVKHLPWTRAPFVVARHTAAYIVRSVQRGHPGDIVNLRRLYLGVPGALRVRWPCPTGSRRLRHLSHAFQESRWPTWVPLSHVPEILP